ncbi:uncharacterized protein LOC122635030 isoform X2 [Vespula pensylvanica]|uniref:uncharacterized protein LOC122635030 isoform X2 n=1 Tax=Vespula pensylvanica TaxID=30213 RepID=UPI001CBA1B85|nr:uncharacterized protein LOC122635030 isoform X2 [Vespula pensylvanica]
MMEKTKDFFLSVTKRVFSNWTALKLAVEHGMGSIDKADLFCHYITDFIYINGLCSSEIACELEDFMDEQFNTELQDLSCKQVAEELYKFYRYCVEGNETQAVIEFEKLPPLQPWIVACLAKKINKGPVAFENDSDSESDEIEESMETEDTEWIQVKPRRKK